MRADIAITNILLLMVIMGVMAMAITLPLDLIMDITLLMDIEIMAVIGVVIVYMAGITEVGTVGMVAGMEVAIEAAAFMAAGMVAASEAAGLVVAIMVADIDKKELFVGGLTFVLVVSSGPYIFNILQNSRTHIFMILPPAIIN